MRYSWKTIHCYSLLYKGNLLLSCLYLNFVVKWNIQLVLIGCSGSPVETQSRDCPVGIVSNYANVNNKQRQLASMRK